MQGRAYNWLRNAVIVAVALAYWAALAAWPLSNGLAF